MTPIIILALIAATAFCTFKVAAAALRVVVGLVLLPFALGRLAWELIK